jgi:hypothetical protein
MWKKIWHGIPKLPIALLGESVFLLLLALIVYNMPAYEYQTVGFAIPGAVIGMLGLAFTFMSPEVKRRL